MLPAEGEIFARFRLEESMPEIGAVGAGAATFLQSFRSKRELLTALAIERFATVTADAEAVIALPGARRVDQCPVDVEDDTCRLFRAHERRVPALGCL